MNNKYESKDLFKMDAVEIYKLILRGDLKRFPLGFWQRPEAEQNAIKITKYLIKDVLKLSNEDLKEKLSNKLFRKNKLRGMLALTNESCLDLMELVYPKDFKRWEFNCVGNGYWEDNDNCKEAIIWLVEEKLKLSDEKLMEVLSQKTFIDNGLRGMLANKCKNSPFYAINMAYPSKFKPWNFNNVPLGYWSEITGVDATRWLIEEKLKFSDEDVKKSLSKQLFIDNGLGGMLSACFNDSPFFAINKTYPSKFKKSDLLSYSYFK